MSHGSYIFWAEAAAITRQINYVIVMDAGILNQVFETRKQYIQEMG